STTRRTTRSQRNSVSFSNCHSNDLPICRLRWASWGPNVACFNAPERIRKSNPVEAASKPVMGLRNEGRSLFTICDLRFPRELSFGWGHGEVVSKHSWDLAGTPFHGLGPFARQGLVRPGSDNLMASPNSADIRSQLTRKS